MSIIVLRSHVRPKEVVSMEVAYMRMWEFKVGHVSLRNLKRNQRVGSFVLA